MLIFSAQSLAFIAVPKTGTTALEAALRPRADIIFAKRHKHMTAQRFHARVAPFLSREFNLKPELFAVIRDPEEQIRSWYRYRARQEKAGSERGTRGVSFDEFVRFVISENPPAFAAIGSQMGMVSKSGKRVLVHHLFAHEQPSHLRGFLASRFGEEFVLKPRNVSPTLPAPLEPATRARLHAARAAEFDLYRRILEAGGHLISPVE